MQGQDTQVNTQGSSPRRKRAQPASTGVPNEATLAVARAADTRVKNRITTIRHGFIRLPRDLELAAGDDLKPPLATLLGASRGAMRLTLYLALLWMAGGGEKKKGHQVGFPARAFAELLGLDDPDGSGQRRVREALKVFADEKLVTLADRPGHPKMISLLREDGSEEAYDRPGDHFDKNRDPADADDSVHRFIQLAPEFWTEGWAQVLSAPGVAMLLVLLLITGNGREKNKWVSMSERRLYGLSDDTWTRGIAELTGYGILAVRRQPVSPDAFAWKRVRNTYSLIPERLDRRPDATIDEDAASPVPPAVAETALAGPKLGRPAGNRGTKSAG